MSYFKQVAYAETAKAKDKFPGLTEGERRQVDALFFKDDWKTLKTLANSSTKSPAFRAYAKEMFEDLQMIAWDKKNQQRT